MATWEISRRRKLRAAGLMAGCLIATSAWAQPAPVGSAPSDDEKAWRQKMEERMNALEKENSELKKELAESKKAPPTTAPPATGTQSPPQVINIPPVTQGGTATAPSVANSPLSLDPRAGGQVTPLDFDVHKYVAEGNFPGSIKLPGTNTSLQIGGFVQVDAITDSNRIGSKDSFVVSSIPTSGESAGQSNFSVRQTRLFIKTETPTDLGPLVTMVEGDFFGPDGTDLRLRHAYGQIGQKHQLLAGQTWTTFMDASTYPAIFDYQGPNGMILARQAMIRYTEVLENDLQLQFAIEDPNPDLSQASNVSGSGSSLLPDLVGNVRWTPKWGHLQLAGIFRQMTFDPPVGPRSSEIGWGFNFTGGINVGDVLEKGKQDNVVFQLAGGKGIANYFNDTNGLGADGFTNSAGDLDTLAVYGGFVAYQHYWSKKFASSFGYSYMQVDNNVSQGGDSYHRGHYVVANFMYYPTDRIWMGIEALYGIREDKNGNEGDDGRVSFSVQYRF